MYKHFRLVPFLVGIGLGFVILNYYVPPPSVILEYPHPSNVNDRVYRDSNGVCYSYKVKEVGCDENEATLKPYPLQS